MKVNILTCTFCLLAIVGTCSIATAQIEGVFDAPLLVTYEVVLNTSGYEETYQGDLQVGADRSLFHWVKQGEDRLETDEMGHIHEIKHRFAGCVNYHEQAGAAHWSTRQPLQDSVIVIEEILPATDWQILPETRVQKGYTLQKARGTYSGRTYTVWFIPELPYRAGPWKLQGLPGLIVEAADQAGEVSFFATSIKKRTDNTAVRFTLDGRFMDSRTYYTRLISEPVKRMKLMQAKLPKGSSISISGFQPNFIEKEYEAVAKELMESLNEGG